MKAYIVLFTAAFLIAATAIFVNTMTTYARSPENMIGGGANMTADASKLAPSGSTKRRSGTRRENFHSCLP